VWLLCLGQHQGSTRAAPARVFSSGWSVETAKAGWGPRQTARWGSAPGPPSHAHRFALNSTSPTFNTVIVRCIAAPCGPESGTTVPIIGSWRSNAGWPTPVETPTATVSLNPEIRFKVSAKEDRRRGLRQTAPRGHRPAPPALAHHSAPNPAVPTFNTVLVGRMVLNLIRWHAPPRLMDR
jgi:hypothetical protein